MRKLEQETVFGNVIITGGREFKSAYRYQLYRAETCPPSDSAEKSVRTLCFVMLNPSTADATEDDPTIRRCRDYARRWGFEHLYVVNLFAFRATDPSELYEAHLRDVDIVGPENDDHIFRVAEESDIVIAAWGVPPRGLLWREAEVRELFQKKYSGKVRALGLTKNAHPRHPLYMRKHVKPFPFLGALLYSRKR